MQHGTEEQTISLKVREGEPLVVSKRRLTADSPKFRYLLDELKYDELLMDDFSTEAVSLFLIVLEDKTVGDIHSSIFRELHKLAAVFEIGWLIDDCYSWFRGKAKVVAGDEDKYFLFEESWYIFKKWGKRDLMDVTISRLSQESNTTFVFGYMFYFDFNKLETEQIDMLLELGGSDTELFIRTILLNLIDKRELGSSTKQLLQKMNLALCYEQNEELYMEVFETISNLSEISDDDIRLTHQLTLETMRLVYSRREKRKCATTVIDEGRKHEFQTVWEILDSVSEGRVVSMYVVVELLLHIAIPIGEETQMFLATLTNICTERGLQKISQKYLDTIIAALVYSNLSQSDQLLTLLNTIKSNENLSTFNESVIITRDKLVPVSETEYNQVFPFTHPGIKACTRTGKCGFILRKVDSDWTRELCTESEDYTGTGIHYHDIVSADGMFWYTVKSGVTANGHKVTVVGGWDWEEKWLPYITDWKFEKVCIAYDIADYLVVKRS